MKLSKTKYTGLLKEIHKLVEQSRHNIAQNINTELLFTYWHVGKLIVEKENQEKYDEQTSRQLILELSKDLTKQVGKGFSDDSICLI